MATDAQGLSLARLIQRVGKSGGSAMASTGMGGRQFPEREERGPDKPSWKHGSHPSTAHSEDERESQPGPSHGH